LPPLSSLASLLAGTATQGTGYTIGTSGAVVGTITNDDAPATPPTPAPPTPAPTNPAPTNPAPTNPAPLPGATTVWVFDFNADGSAPVDVTALPGYGVATSALFNFGGGGWAGWSVPAGKIVLGAKIISSGDTVADFSVFKAAGPNEVYPHWRYGPAEYGWVMQAKQANHGVQIEVYYADPPTIDVQVSPANVAEDGPDKLTYTFTATGPLTRDVTVAYEIGGSATAGSDFTGLPAGASTGAITIPANSGAPGSAATLAITPTPDTVIEFDETVVISLLPGTGYTFDTTRPPATGTIENDDYLVDIDVDSNNDRKIDTDNGPAGTDDPIEDIAGIDAKPGKVLLVNDQDTDNDGIQDYFDGFNAFATLDEDDLLGNASFAPMSLALAGLPTHTPVTLDYSGSDPSLLIEDSTGRLVPAPGHLRVWTVDATFSRSASQLRAGGHYVPPGTYSLQELGITSGQTLTLYVEAIRPSVATGDLSVTVSVPSTPLSDRVRFTSTQFTVLGKALDEPFQETGFFISSTLPSPAAVGQDGIMAGAYREYRVQINDPRTTTTNVQIAGASLPLSRSGTTLESPTFVLIAPGTTAHPTLRSIEASGPFVSWAFNAGARRRLVTSFQLTEWDTELAGIIIDVIKQMDGTWRPSNPDNPGEFGDVVHQRVGERLKGRAGWAVDVYVRNATNEIVSIGKPPGDRTGTTQIDALKLKPGYTLEGKTVLDYTQIDDLYDVKTTASGIPDPKQAERLKSVLNGWQPGGQRSIKVGMVERRWVASAGWVDNARGKNAIGLVRMIGLAAGVAQTSQTAHAMWSFKDDDPEFQSLLNAAQRVKQNSYQQNSPSHEQRAYFIRWEVMPFLRKRFGDSAQLNVADEVAFRKFLEDLK
jgi:hypothetical protein